MSPSPTPAPVHHNAEQASLPSPESATGGHAPAPAITPAVRLTRLPPYLFGKLNNLRTQMRQAGRDIIDLGMGNPNDPTPQPVVEQLNKAALDPKNHRYGVAGGIVQLRQEVARKYLRHRGVKLDPAAQVLACLGSKEAFSHFCLALLGPGDTAIVGDPAYPIHIYGPTLAGAAVLRVPLGNDLAFLERVERMIEQMLPRPKLLVLNYPHNPTALTVEDRRFFDRAVQLAHRYGVIVVNDYAYGDVCFDGYQAPSILEADGAFDVAVEFSTMSKTYNMAGWRLGFCCGNAQMVKMLATVKGYYDYGIFAPIQVAGIVAMRHGDAGIREQCAIYTRRRDLICELCRKIGWQAERPRASMFVWTRVPEQHAPQGTIDLALRLLEHAEVVLAPGAGFGENGELHMRIAMVENEKRLRQAFRQIEAYLKRGRSTNTAGKRAVPITGAQGPTP